MYCRIGWQGKCLFYLYLTFSKKKVFLDFTRFLADEQRRSETSRNFFVGNAYEFIKRSKLASSRR